MAFYELFNIRKTLGSRNVLTKNILAVALTPHYLPSIELPFVYDHKDVLVGPASIVVNQVRVVVSFCTEPQSPLGFLVGYVAVVPLLVHRGSLYVSDGLKLWSGLQEGPYLTGFSVRASQTARDRSHVQRAGLGVVNTRHSASLSDLAGVFPGNLDLCVREDVKLEWLGRRR